MKRTLSKTEESDAIVLKLETGVINACILGKTGIILNRMTEKVKHELLMPKGRKTAADKAGTLKHDPLQEYRDAPYIMRGESSPTYLGVLSTAVKSAIRDAALMVPGAKKSEIGRLLWVEGEYCPVYGKPQLIMSVTRSADMKKTPDVRTRCILPEWAMRVRICYVKPHLNMTSVVSLLGVAGMTMGIGDWRPQKGSGTFGQFTVVDESNKDFQHIIKTGGRKLQIDGMKNPECYDAETEEMIGWFQGESRRRGITAVA